MKIHWRYQYVPEGQLEPDKHGRWQVVGEMFVDTNKVYPDWEYGKSLFKDGTLPIIIAHIMRLDDGRFCSQIPSLKYVNAGLGSVNFTSDNLEDLKKNIENEYALLANAFKYAVSDEK
jgi:hypothetical protein